MPHTSIRKFMDAIAKSRDHHILGSAHTKRVAVPTQIIGIFSSRRVSPILCPKKTTSCKKPTKQSLPRLCMLFLDCSEVVVVRWNLIRSQFTIMSGRRLRQKFKSQDPRRKCTTGHVEMPWTMRSSHPTTGPCLRVVFCLTTGRFSSQTANH